VEVFDIVDPGVSEAVESACDLRKMQEALGGANVRLEADDNLFRKKIHTDQTKMCLILTNLLSNALKFKQREVRLKCTFSGDSLLLSVKDDGPGIPESYHQQIFDQYFQCVKVEGFPVRGHGLGLAGALALTEALGGSLSLCKCEKGAEFLVQVDCSPQD
jgi:K+-sensing histidine kinase KdpD